MKLNKKSIYNGVLIVLALIIALILFGGITTADNFVTSLTDGDGTDSVTVSVKGDLKVVDSATILDIEPSLSTINVNTVSAGGLNLKFFSFLGIGEEDFTYTVKLYDAETNQLRDTYVGDEVLKSKDNEGILVPYTLSFKVLDKNEDGQIDDFKVRIVATLTGDDIGSVKTQARILEYKDGGILQ